MSNRHLLTLTYLSNHFHQWPPASTANYCYLQTFGPFRTNHVHWLAFSFRVFSRAILELGAWAVSDAVKQRAMYHSLTWFSSRPACCECPVVFIVARIRIDLLSATGNCNSESSGRRRAGCRSVRRLVSDRPLYSRLSLRPVHGSADRRVRYDARRDYSRIINLLSSN